MLHVTSHMSNHLATGVKADLLDRLTKAIAADDEERIAGCQLFMIKSMLRRMNANDTILSLKQIPESGSGRPPQRPLHQSRSRRAWSQASE